MKLRSGTRRLSTSAICFSVSAQRQTSPPSPSGLLHTPSSIHQLASVFAYSPCLHERRLGTSEWISRVGRVAGLASTSITERKNAVTIAVFLEEPHRCGDGWRDFLFVWASARVNTNGEIFVRLFGALAPRVSTWCSGCLRPPS